MPKMHIEKKKFIKAPLTQVYDILADMGQWQQWSPWLISDPDANVTVNPDGKSYSWQGSRVGEGHMSITQQERGKSIDYDLTFLKPWKSTAKVKMETRSSSDGTEVHWSMDSSLPFFMFWMKKQMEAYIGSDYDRGLNLLKDYAEDGNVHSELRWVGLQDRPGSTFLGLTRRCKISDIGEEMESDFTELMTYAHHTEGMLPEQAFCQYEKWDVVKGNVQYTVGVPYATLPSDAPSKFKQGKMPNTKVYTIEHRGPYEHMGNAWSTMMSMQRNKEFKVRKGIPPFETYGNSPKDTAPNDLVTQVHFPVV